MRLHNRIYYITLIPFGVADQNAHPKSIASQSGSSIYQKYTADEYGGGKLSWAQQRLMSLRVE
jgi:hypothetical protein